MNASKTTPDNKLLLRAAHQVADGVFDALGTDVVTIYIADDIEVEQTGTGGWFSQIGDLLNDPVRIEIWLDNYSGAVDRRFWAGLSSSSRQAMQPAIDALPARWRVHREITPKHVHFGRTTKLKEPLDHASFGKTILEKYGNGQTFIGFYDPIDPFDSIGLDRFTRHAVNFFVDIIKARGLPELIPIDPDDYASHEPRVVRLHTAHDRNRKLARRCKERDKYTCQVCGIRFVDFYGDLGHEYAECHHIVPLSQLKEGQPTALDDLITVCANCHRMLHRMDGKASDVKQLVNTILRVRKSVAKRSGS